MTEMQFMIKMQLMIVFFYFAMTHFWKSMLTSFLFFIPFTSESLLSIISKKKVLCVWKNNLEESANYFRSFSTKLVFNFAFRTETWVFIRSLFQSSQNLRSNFNFKHNLLAMINFDYFKFRFSFMNSLILLSSNSSLVINVWKSVSTDSLEDVLPTSKYIAQWIFI